ncbi:MAG: GHMP family kinase ATP-binding protein [Planctomycetota bacterium]|jgi:D-glycero-alpha-D-manno-heptose-7-phosphate kinase
MAGVIRASAPCRVDLLGGTLDVRPLPELLGDVTTVNAAITIRAEAAVAPAPQWRLEATDIAAVAEAEDLSDIDPGDPVRLLRTVCVAISREVDEARWAPVSLTTRSAAPPKSGLGGSSAMVIAMLAALQQHFGIEEEPFGLPFLAGDIEAHVLQAPTGLQDYFPAVHGGMLCLNFGVGASGFSPLAAEGIDELDDHLVVAYTGLSHASGELNWSVLRAIIDGDAAQRARIEQIAAVAEDGMGAVLDGDWAALGAALNDDWAVRRELGPGISTPECETMLGAARTAGALGARLTGAGGGGCLVALAPPAERDAVRAALTDAGAQVLDCVVDREGLRVETATDGDGE